MTTIHNDYSNAVSSVLDELHAALQRINSDSTAAFIDALLSAEKVYFIGVGRVLLSLQAMAKRFNHLGIGCHVVGEITEPAITDKDVLVVGSGSGSSIIPVHIAKKAKEFGAKIIHIGSNPHGEIEAYTDLMVRIPVRTKMYLDDEIDSCQPMTSLFEQSLLLFGDIVAKIIIDRKKMNLKELWQYHANLE